MPIYEFECQQCGQPFEELVFSSSAINDVKCPECGSGEIRKKISMFASKPSGSGNMFSMSSAGSSCSTTST